MFLNDTQLTYNGLQLNEVADYTSNLIKITKL
jgi:hypothetical protein